MEENYDGREGCGRVTRLEENGRQGPGAPVAKRLKAFSRSVLETVDVASMGRGERAISQGCVVFPYLNGLLPITPASRYPIASFP